MCQLKCRRHSLLRGCCTHGYRLAITGPCSETEEPFDMAIETMKWGLKEKERAASFKRPQWMKKKKKQDDLFT